MFMVPFSYCPSFILLLADVMARQAAMAFKCLLLIYYKNGKGHSFRRQVWKFSLVKGYHSIYVLPPKSVKGRKNKLFYGICWHTRDGYCLFYVISLLLKFLTNTIWFSRVKCLHWLNILCCCIVPYYLHQYGTDSFWIKTTEVCFHH